MASSEEEPRPKVVAELAGGYIFDVTFPGTVGKMTFVMDEPPPLGSLAGPNASRMLAAAIANCLSASLLFCLNRSKIDVKSIHTEAEPVIERNKDGYWRVTRIDVRVKPVLESSDPGRANRCLDIFENYCVVTGAVREGIQINVKVEPEIKAREG